MKAREVTDRCPHVRRSITIAVAGLLGSGVTSMASAAEQAPHTTARTAAAPATPPTETRPARNAILASATFPIPDYGVGLTYLRAFGRRFSVSGGIEYTLPRRGHSHLIGLSESVGGQVWVTRALHGVFAEVDFTVAHTSLTRAAQLRRVVVAPGLGAGFRWQFDVGLVLGVTGSLRFARSVGGSELICTRPDTCPATRSGIYARVGAEVGWAF